MSDGSDSLDYFDSWVAANVFDGEHDPRRLTTMSRSAVTDAVRDCVEDLDDISVLVQIPRVRELVEELEDITAQFGSDYLFEKHNERHVRPWLDALEATR